MQRMAMPRNYQEIKPTYIPAEQMTADGADKGAKCGGLGTPTDVAWDGFGIGTDHRSQHLDLQIASINERSTPSELFHMRFTCSN